MKFSSALFILSIVSCSFVLKESKEELPKQKPASAECLIPLETNFQTGADQMDLVLEQLKGKKVGLVANPSSEINSTHLVDSLISSGIALQRIFCPEHGFRGEGAAGAKINDSIDEKTGLKIVSLYGKNKKPKARDISDLDILVFDIQDVGARFYTYISTLHYVMEAAAENDIPVLILDRPNPNGYAVDGPILNKKFESFIGMHEIPVVHGMTIGEYAQMINGEGWLLNGIQCELNIIKCALYSHNMKYELPVKPSPNLPNTISVLAYPSLCFFEGTAVSVGRGTDRPFQVWGHPKMEEGSFKFSPKSRKEAPQPKLENQKCLGYEYDSLLLNKLLCNAKLDLQPLLQAYASLKDKTEFFTRPDFFDLLAGSDVLRKQIIIGKTEEEIRKSWEPGLTEFKKTRQKYLLYP